MNFSDLHVHYDSLMRAYQCMQRRVPVISGIRWQLVLSIDILVSAVLIPNCFNVFSTGNLPPPPRGKLTDLDSKKTTMCIQYLTLYNYYGSPVYLRVHNFD